MSTLLPGGTSAAYGKDLAKNFGVDDASSIVTRSLQHPRFAATELRIDHPNGQLSETIPVEDAYIITVVLRDFLGKSYWEEGREIRRSPAWAGVSTISDLKRKPRVVIDKPIHALLIYLPRLAMNVLAEEANLPPVSDLIFEPGGGFRDDTFWNLGQSLLPALRRPEQVNPLFTDHIVLALASHAAYTYGGRRISRPVRGGLAPWQEKRAKDLILADLVGSTSMAEIAAACGLSASHFARSFRKTTGFAPHAWLLRARIRQAMTLLGRRDTTLASIARDCGFADQSHFARVFTRQTGRSPTAWRRLSIR